MAAQLSSVKVSSNKSSSEAVEMFPSEGLERTGYLVWAYKTHALFMSKGLEKYLERPLFGLPEQKGSVFEEKQDVKYLKPTATIDSFQHKVRSAKVFGMLVQSLHAKHAGGYDQRCYSGKRACRVATFTR
jgi:hypothetical protein